MNRIPLIALIALTGLSAACTSNPVSTTRSETARFSCENFSMQQNITAGAVLSACGQPAYRDAWGGGNAAEGPDIAAVEEWYFNRGPNQPIQVLRFLNGQLISVKQDGIGFIVRNDRNCSAGAISPGLSKYRLIQACGEPLTRQAYIVDPSYLLPDAPVFSQGNATIVGQENKQPVYREDLAYKIGNTVETVTLQNGRVLTVGQRAGRG